MLKRQEVLLEMTFRKANKGITILHPTEHVRTLESETLLYLHSILRDFLKVV